MCSIAQLCPTLHNPMDCSPPGFSVHGIFQARVLGTNKLWDSRLDFPAGSDGKASAYNAGDPGSTLGWEDLLEKKMATHSNILTWKIPWTEKPGGLQSMRSQRVGHNWAAEHSTHTYVYIWIYIHNIKHITKKSQILPTIKTVDYCTSITFFPRVLLYWLWKLDSSWKV